MTDESNVFVVNKQALIEAAVELEKQEFLASFMLLQCVEQLNDVHRKLNAVLDQAISNKARHAFLNLFMSEKAWDEIMSDASAQWLAERRQEAVNLKRPRRPQ